MYFLYSVDRGLVRISSYSEKQEKLVLARKGTLEVLSLYYFILFKLAL